MHMTYLEGKSNEKNVFFCSKIFFFCKCNHPLGHLPFLWDIMHYIAKCKETTVDDTAATYYYYICTSFFKHVSSLIKSVSQNYCIGGEWRRIVSALFLLRRLLASIICSKQNQTHNF